ncbi:hypothetical protein NKG05_22950 [Oerskovia sp. M15]
MGAAAAVPDSTAWISASTSSPRVPFISVWWATTASTARESSADVARTMLLMT